MNDNDDNRPDPDQLLEQIKSSESGEKSGKLKIFFGMSAGVGKTYSMLQAARKAKSEDRDVVIGYLETHGRPETESLAEGIETIPVKTITYRGIVVKEMNLEEIIARKPELVLVDELAHTNAPGSKHLKRYQDVYELLEKGIDVYTTVNVQHLESRADTVAEITGIKIHETVPDSIIDIAEDIELIDISPEDLFKRLKEGKVYVPDKASLAVKNFFRRGNLNALREMALRVTAERVDKELRSYMRAKNIPGPWKSGERLMVAIGPSPLSAHLIRWTRRTAFTMDAKWIAVYVDSGQSMTTKSKEQLAANILLAQELGAELVATSDTDVVDGLIRTAKQYNISQIIIGKPVNTGSWSARKSNDIVSRLIRESGNIDIYVVRGEKLHEPKPKKLELPEIQSGIIQYMIATLAIILVAFACAPITHFIGYQTVGLLLLLTVASLALFVGRGPILIAAIMSALIWNYFFIPPLYTFHIGRLEDLLTLLMNFIIALVTGILTTRIRYQQKTAKAGEERVASLYSLSKLLASSRSITDIANISIKHIQETSKIECVILLPNPEGILTPIGDNPIQLNGKEMSVAIYSFENSVKAGKLTRFVPLSDFQYQPLVSAGGILGVIGLKFSPLYMHDLDHETMLNNYIIQLTGAIEREILNEKAKSLLVISESEKLYKTLLNSVSHELRTPIAIITGASSVLGDDDVDLNQDMIRELGKEVQIASARLNRLVENLLDMTRLESGMMKLKPEWCDIDDLINVTLIELKTELSRNKVILDISPDLPLIKIDFVLMKQALTNILHNAANYTPIGTSIFVDSMVTNRKLKIIIRDSGPGVPEESIPRLFEKFYRAPNTKSGGTGLGLSITKGLVEAQGGTIIADLPKEGGLRFTVSIPLDEGNTMEKQGILEGRDE